MTTTDKWAELRETINELHEENADNPDVENVTRFLLNLMDVKDRTKLWSSFEGGPMETIKRKLTSRKFWAAVCTFVTMLMIYNGKAESDAQQVAALIMAGATVVAYIIGEGMADAGNKAFVVEPEDDVE